MPIYPGRRKGTHRIVIWVKGVPHEEIFEGTKEAAKRYEARRRLEFHARPKALERVAPRFGDFSTNVYGPHAQASQKARSWNTRRYQLSTLDEFFGHVRLDQFLDERILGFKGEVRERFAPGYVNGLLSALFAVLNFARARGQPVPLLSRARERLGKTKARAWSMAEIRKLYAAAAKESPWLVDMLHFLLDTGCRKGELVAAVWDWVDFDARMLRIRKHDGWEPKDRDERDVPLSDALFERLRQKPREHRYVFVNQYGVPYERFADGTFWAVQETAGVEGHVHMTRHTFASHFLKAQADLPLLATVMGHTMTYVTETYVHMLPEHLARARNAVQLSPPSAEWGALAKRRS